MTPCPSSLPALSDGTGREVALTLADWAAQYHRCAARHNGLVEVLEERAQE